MPMSNSPLCHRFTGRWRAPTDGRHTHTVKLQTFRELTGHSCAASSLSRSGKNWSGRTGRLGIKDHCMDSGGSDRDRLERRVGSAHDLKKETLSLFAATNFHTVRAAIRFSVTIHWRILSSWHKVTFIQKIAMQKKFNVVKSVQVLHQCVVLFYLL